MTKSDPERNICSYKAECKSCVAVERDNRPAGCIEHGCILFTPCVKCGINRKLDPETKRCPFCKGSKEKVNSNTLPMPGLTQVTTPSGELVNPSDLPMSWEAKTGHVPSMKSMSSVSRVDRTPPVLTPPGTPPSNYNCEESEYYLGQWGLYQGFYRDPTSFATLHQIIILEIELNQWTALSIQSRGEYNEMVNKQRTQIIANLKSLREQLPDKEANQLNEDEKALSMIHMRYQEEVEKKTYTGKDGKRYRQVISPQAIALAPVLPFAVNLEEIIRRTGYTMAEASDVFEEMHAAGTLPTDAREVAKFFGYPILDKYAVTEEERRLYAEEEVEEQDENTEEEEP